MRAPRKALFIALILLATILQFPLAIGDPDWLEGWDYRVKITIDSGDIDTALIDFPVLIYLSDSSGINGENVSFVFDEVGANSLKIAVTLSDGTTECYVEVEKWDLGNRQAWLWTKIASISNITDTEIYLYYDNDHANNGDKVGLPNSVPAENVWDENFIFVSHMRDDPDTSNVRDSTENNNDGSKEAGNNPLLITNGKIGEAQDFSGDYIQLVTALDIMPDDLTVEMWIKPDVLALDYLFDKRNGLAPNNRIKLHLEADGDLRFWGEANGGGFKFVRHTNSVSVGIWYYVAGVHTHNAALKCYINNVEETGEVLGNIGDGSARNLQLGTDGSQTIDFDGKIDEIRISGSARNSAWLKASYESGKDDLLDFGSEEERPPLETPNKLFGAGFNASSPYVSLYWKSNLTDITLFEVQNSTDNVSWDTLGSNTTREYHDFQVVNGTERYYRVRACNFTGAEWDNSTFTDINFETVYFVEAAAGDTYVTGSVGIFLIVLIIIIPIVFYAVRKR